MNLHLLQTGPLKVNTCIVPLAENYVFIVDPADCSFSRDEGSVVSFLNSENLKPLALILTHGHFDHVSGLPSIKEAFPDISIAIHKNDAAMIGDESKLLQSKALYQMGFKQFLPFVSKLPEASHFLEDKKTLAEIFADCDFIKKQPSSAAKAALEKWRVLHTPGHTEGSCCFYNESNLTLISGDTLFYRSWGRTDLIGGDERKIHQSLARIMEICKEECQVYPGHDDYGFTLAENY